MSFCIPARAAARLTALGGEYQLPETTIEILAGLLGMIASDPLAPSAVRDPDIAVDRHVADSLVALRLDPVRAAGAIADLGSGSGLPGLVLAAALPRARVALVESNGRKADFIARAVAALGLRNATAVNARAEAWEPGRAANDVVTARALARLDVVAEYAAPLLRVGGMLVAWTGRRDPAVEGEARVAAMALGLQDQGPVRVAPFAGAEHRHLHLMSKLTETPTRFPRRPGAALKHPLGRRTPTT